MLHGSDRIRSYDWTMYYPEDVPAWVQQYAEWLAPSDLTVMLADPLDLARLRSELRDVPQKVAIKPRGFWFACGGAWIQHVYGQGMTQFYGDYVYTLALDKSRIAHLLTEGDALRFHRAYAKFKGEDALIDWQRVAMDYDGILICPLLQSVRRRLVWYYPWDVPSGCIWRSRALLGVEDISPTMESR